MSIVKSPASLGSIVTKGVERLLSDEFTDYWILAGLADGGFEEPSGVKSGKWFGPFMKSLAGVGVRLQLLEQLKDGVNGHLRTLLTRGSGLSLGPKSVGRVRPDIILCDGDNNARAVLEVKVIWDCVYKKTYQRVVDDRTKLTQVLRPRLPQDAELFQLVFFVGFPALRYPRGNWYGKDVAHNRPVVCHGVTEQWRYLQSKMSTSHRENVHKFFSRNLEASPELESLIVQWLASAYVPAEVWRFDARVHMRDAVVAAAIWQY